MIKKYAGIIKIATAFCAVALGIAFIVCCAHMFFTGGDIPFTRERVGDYLVFLIVPSIITIALIVLGFINYISEGKNDDVIAPRTKTEILSGFVKRYDFDGFDGKTKADVKNERAFRTNVKYTSLTVSVLFALAVIIYVAFFAKFDLDTVNADVISALAVALPLGFISLGSYFAGLHLTEKSCERELNMLKASIKEFGAPAKATCEKAKEHTDSLFTIRVAIIAISLIFVILGIANGGMGDVLGKAVKICTECIGLG